VTRTPAISTNVLQNSAATGADRTDPADRSGQHNPRLASPRKAITGRRTREPGSDEHDYAEGFQFMSENQVLLPTRGNFSSRWRSASRRRLRLWRRVGRCTEHGGLIVFGLCNRCG
jgi:hypothetical protein